MEKNNDIDTKNLHLNFESVFINNEFKLKFKKHLQKELCLEGYVKKKKITNLYKNN
jgi:hypothetical protein